jgi:2-dehydro-3-deoxyphosphogluconate aldolase/(4S)-4-hydroxy-2-oxoglutarate aldolase
MSRRNQTAESIERSGVVAVVRMKDAARVQAVMEALAEGGVRVLEITMTVPGAIELTRSLCRALPDDIVFGAGTVLDADVTKRVVDAGARFVVSPVLKPELIELCHSLDVAALPGCFSPTEILTAWELGADIVKVFPATALGPRYFRDVRGPLPHVKLMPTGGVSVDNAGQWIEAGAVAVGVGGDLLDPQAIASGDYAVLTERARRFVAAVARARS